MVTYFLYGLSEEEASESESSSSFGEEAEVERPGGSQVTVLMWVAVASTFGATSLQMDTISLLFLNIR